MWYETVRVEVNLPQPVPISTQILIRVYDQDDAEDTVRTGTLEHWSTEH